ncbi:hypothetical protein Tco_0236745 [Tanacetum coccineum]
MLVNLINLRKKYFAAQKVEAKINKPLKQAQQRNYIINYIKHIGSHTLQQLKRYSFDELKELFETTMKNVNTFVPMEIEDKGRASELVAGSSQVIITDYAKVGSSKRAAEAELDHEGSKRQNTNEASGDDLVMIWNLVKERFSLTEPTDDKERTLWVDLKRGIDIFMLVEKEYPLSKVVLTLMLVNKLLVEQHSEMANYKDAKTLFAAIQTRLGGNDATKKTQKTLLKQMYENFSAPSAESLDSIFNRLQKIVSQLALLGENISQVDLNLKFLRSLPSKWNTHVVVRRNKPDLDIMSFNDLYNNFKIVKQEVKGTASSSSQNVAFVPASTQVSTASTQVSTANLSDATVYAFLANQPNGSQLVHEDLKQIHEDNLEEIDLKWQLALLSMRTRKFFQKTSRKITMNGSDTAGYDKSKVESFNYHNLGYFARECRGLRNQDNMSRNQDSSRRIINVEEISSKAILAIDGAAFDWSFIAEEEVPTDMAFMVFSDFKSNKSEFNLATYKRGLASVEEQLVFYKKNELEKLSRKRKQSTIKFENFDNASKGEERRENLKQINRESGYLIKFQQPEFEGYRPKTSKSVSEDTSNEVRKSPDASLVEELVSNDKLEKKTSFPTVAKINFVRPQQQEKPVRKPVKYAEMYRCFDHMHANCNYHQSKRMVSGNNYTRISRSLIEDMLPLGEEPKGGRITGKGTLKTGKLDFEDVYFVKEL